MKSNCLRGWNISKWGRSIDTWQFRNNGPFVSEEGRLIPDSLEITDLLKIKVLLLTADIEKAFDSVDHKFLSRVLKTFDMGKT